MIGLAITIGILDQSNNNFVSVMQKNGSQYVVETHLEMEKNDYYIVASVSGDTKQSRILSAVVDIQGLNTNSSRVLGAGDLRSVDCGGAGFCKEQILKGFSIKEEGTYKINLGEFRAVDQVKIMSLSLHSNHSIYVQAVMILAGLLLIITSIFMAFFRLGKMSYSKLLQRIKKYSLIRSAE